MWTGVALGRLLMRPQDGDEEFKYEDMMEMSSSDGDDADPNVAREMRLIEDQWKQEAEEVGCSGRACSDA